MDFRQTHQPGRALPYMIKGHKLHLVEGIALDTMPQGYEIQRCQGTPTLQIHQRRTDNKISGEHGTAESVIALAQIIFATVSLYKSRGDQFARYGYAAFSLTVLPFAVMSFANLVANILSGLYEVVSCRDSGIAPGTGAGGNRNGCGWKVADRGGTYMGSELQKGRR